MSTERTNARRTRQATNNPPPSLRRQDAITHETIVDQHGQAVDFGIYTDQVNDILRSLFGGPVRPPQQTRREVVRSNAPNLPDSMRSHRRRNPEEVDIPPLYAKLPGAGESTIDISPSEEGEMLPEYSEAAKEEDESRSQG